jgi:hypothetical protein
MRCFRASAYWIGETEKAIATVEKALAMAVDKACKKVTKI